MRISDWSSYLCSSDLHDFQWRKLVIDPVHFCLAVIGRDHIAIVEGREIELDRWLQAPFQRHLVDCDGASTVIHRRCVVIRGIKMGAVVGYQFHSLISPCLAGGEILGFQSGEERGQAGNGSVMVDIFEERKSGVEGKGGSGRVEL